MTTTKKNKNRQPQIPMDKESISMTADEQWIWMISTIFWQSIETNNMSHELLDYNTTNDGAEIQLTSWGNGGLSHYLRGFYTSQAVGLVISEPSTVWTSYHLRPTWSHWRLPANSSASRQLAPPQACGKGGGPRLGILKLQRESFAKISDIPK